MVETYLTIAKESTALLKEKSSKFVAYALPVEDTEAVKTELDRIKREHHSARHWCYAYRLGESGAEYRSNDDGEPSHSAGDPILRQIESRELTYTLVIVVRYFGGIKLGVGGLIQAYGGAADLALADARIIEKVIRERVLIIFGYEDMSDVMRITKKYEADMLSNEFLETCEMKVEVDRSQYDSFMEEMGLLHRVETKEL